MKLQSNHALLDVKRGRVGLHKHFFDKPDAEPIPVTIHGTISGIWGHDDGESQEFEVDVTSVETSDTAGAAGLLKELRDVHYDGLGSGCGWNPCNHCNGHPQHKPGCIILKVDAFLKDK